MDSVYEIQSSLTFYRGIPFRSQLEARWAIFFDSLFIKWEYEPRKFYLNTGEIYTPDFYLNDLGWVEIKPDYAKFDSNPKYRIFPSLLKEQSIESPIYYAFVGSQPNNRFLRFISAENQDWCKMLFCICNECHRIALMPELPTETRHLNADAYYAKCLHRIDSYNPDDDFISRAFLQAQNYNLKPTKIEQHIIRYLDLLSSEHKNQKMSFLYKKALNRYHLGHPILPEEIPSDIMRFINQLNDSPKYYLKAG